MGQWCRSLARLPPGIAFCYEEGTRKLREPCPTGPVIVMRQATIRRPQAPHSGLIFANLITFAHRSANDPVRLGLVTSLSRPGGNMTGATQLNMEVAPKRLEIFSRTHPRGD